VSDQAAAREAADVDAGGAVDAAGHFRIYLGAAAGVGKTYAMLSEGHRRLGRGTDVIIGFVECHGRQRTEEMIDGLARRQQCRLLAVYVGRVPASAAAVPAAQPR
jgi:K+-sensing histidine kinase KdpD